MSLGMERHRGSKSILLTPEITQLNKIDQFKSLQWFNCFYMIISARFNYRSASCLFSSHSALQPTQRKSGFPFTSRILSVLPV